MKNTEFPNIVEFEVTGDYGLFSDPVTRVGGKKAPIKCRPTKRLKGF